MIFGVHGVVFHGVDARDIQECAALQNNAKNVYKLMNIVEKSKRTNFQESKNEMLGIV